MKRYFFNENENPKEEDSETKEETPIVDGPNPNGYPKKKD